MFSGNVLSVRSRVVAMARAVVYENGKVSVVTKAVPEPANPKDVVVRLTLRPLHRSFELNEAGRVANTIGAAAVPGYEGVGVVHSVGKGVTKVKVGQRVVPFLFGALEQGQGSWQEYVVVAEDLALRVSDAISNEAAAQFIVNPWTSFGLVERLGVPPGGFLLQTAAGSVVGRQVIQLAKHLGLKTINIVRRSAQKEELKALGADEVISSTDEDVVARVKEITHGTLAYGALDAVGGPFTKTVCGCVRNGGEVIVYGAMSGSYDVSCGLRDLFRNVKVTGWFLFNAFEEESQWRLLEERVGKLLEQKVMVPLGGDIFDLGDVQAALRRSEEVGQTGKVLLRS